MPIRLRPLNVLAPVARRLQPATAGGFAAGSPASAIFEFRLHAFGGYLSGLRRAAAGERLGPTRGAFVCHHIVFCFAMAGHRDGRFATAA
jgi:hypothetical protein